MVPEVQTEKGTALGRMQLLACVWVGLASLLSLPASAAYVDYGMTLGTLRTNGVVVASGGLFELGFFSSYDDSLGADYFAERDYSMLRSDWTVLPGSETPLNQDGLFYRSGLDTLGVAIDTRLFAWAFSSTTPEDGAAWSILSGQIGGTSVYDAPWLSLQSDNLLVMTIEIGTTNTALYKNSSPSNAMTPNDVEPADGSADLRVFQADAPAFSDASYTARAPGGVILLSRTSAAVGVHLPPGASAWESLSDREAKTKEAAIDPPAILAALEGLPVSSWEYRDQPGQTHIGPMAQDFQAAFGLGLDATTISTLDVDGVALAAIQALVAEIGERKARLAAQDARVQALERRLRDLGEKLQASGPTP